MILPKDFEQAIPKFYGATTIGERGQIVIPADARKHLGLSPSTKVMVFGGNTGEGLLIIKAESVAEYLAKASSILSNFEKILHAEEDPATGK